MSAYRHGASLTARAERYIASREHIAAERDANKIAEALERAGVPALRTWIEFQRAYGGLVEYDGENRFEWGLIHAAPHPYSPLAPNHVDALVEDGETFVSCCNCHMSDHWMLDAQGALLWCFPPPVAASFEKHVERGALFWELEGAEGVRGLRVRSPESAREVLLPRVAEHLVAEASDTWTSVYLRDGVLVMDRPRNFRVFAVGNGSRAILAGVVDGA